MSAQDRVFRALEPDLAYTIDEFWSGPVGARCESEIERIFVVTLLMGAKIRSQPLFSSREEAAVATRNGIFIEPQVVIGQYRVDFLLGLSTGVNDLLKCVVVECDGHDFHERTKDQAARDKARDRYLSAHVGRIARFTGSELYRDPSACIVEAMKLLSVANGWLPK